MEYYSHVLTFQERETIKGIFVTYLRDNSKVDDCDYRRDCNLPFSTFPTFFLQFNSQQKARGENTMQQSQQDFYDCSKNSRGRLKPFRPNTGLRSVSFSSVTMWSPTLLFSNIIELHRQLYPIYKKIEIVASDTSHLLLY